MKRLIIEVERNELRLPVRVCDSYKEMSIATGVEVARIRQSCESSRKGINSRFERVYIEEE